MNNNTIRAVTLYEETALKLKEAQSRYKNFFADAPMAYQSLDLEGYILEVNEVWLRLFGYSESEVIGRHITKFIYYEDINKAKNSLKEMLESGSVSEVTCRLLTKQGDIKYVAVTGKISYEDKKAVRTQCILVDITKQKEIEAQNLYNVRRRDALLKLSSLLDSSERDIFNFAVEEITNMTGSNLGYIGVVNADRGRITQVAYNGKAMQSCNLKESLNITYDIKKCGVWAEAIKKEVPIIITDYKKYNSPNKKGYPKGHVTIVNNLNVPIKNELGKIVLLAGVANKIHSQYVEDDVKQISLFMEGVWRLIVTKDNIIKNTTTKPIKILIIEDDATIASLLLAQLQKTVDKVFVAATATEGLSIYNKNKIDLVILDLRLPGMDGEECLKHLKNKNHGIR